MSIVHFSGTVKTGSYTEIVSLVEQWVGSAHVKMRTHNEEIVYRDDNTHLYIHNPVVEGTTLEKFLIEGERKGALESVRVFLQLFARICKERGLNLEMGYWEVDAAGRDIGEEYEL